MELPATNPDSLAIVLAEIDRALSAGTFA